MKTSKTFKTIVLVLVSSMFLFSGCEKIKGYIDEADGDGDGGGGGNQSENVFTYKGTDYQLDEGYMEDYGEGYRDGSYNIDLTLISDDETNGIYFEMFTSTDGDLKTGTYNYDSDETEDPGTFDYGDCWGPDEEIEINGGTVRIQKSGNTYTITINVSSSGNSISGYYKGPLDK